MTQHSQTRVVNRLLQKHGLLWSDEVGIHLERGTPSPLFRWLCLSLLLSARIRERIAVRAAVALAKNGWVTPEKMVAASWEDRTRTLNESGYARYDERTSRMLGDTAQLVLDRYGGDMRQLREESNRRPEQERKRLKEFKGLGDVGVDIFFREIQNVWSELFPFADGRALKAARRLGLGDDARTLAPLVSRDDFPRLIAGLVRVDLSNDYDFVLEPEPATAESK